jgi:hypothetical protein
MGKWQLAIGNWSEATSRSLENLRGLAAGQGEIRGWFIASRSSAAPFIGCAVHRLRRSSASTVHRCAFIGCAVHRLGIGSRGSWLGGRAHERILSNKRESDTLF